MIKIINVKKSLSYDNIFQIHTKLYLALNRVIFIFMSDIKFYLCIPNKLGFNID